MVKEALTAQLPALRIGWRNMSALPPFLRFRYEITDHRHFDIAPQQRIRRIGNILPPQ
jgi:hypothetical protein